VDPPAYAAVVLAGGAARRLGGVLKPTLPVAGRSMLDRVLTAVRDAEVRVAVGPADLPVPPGVALTREDPPGGGPVAAAAAGLALVPARVGAVALLAGDLPLLDRDAVDALRRAAAAGADPATGPDVAVFVDAEGRRQHLCGVWRRAALRTALDRLAADGPLAGAAVRRLLAGVRVAEVSYGAGPPPWFDCDTDADLRRAEEWVG
jgi:molybdopterin-guanine dinucleotide biosynthesis protein A